MNLDAVQAIARALRAELKLHFVSSGEDLLRQQAAVKASQLVAMNEGSTAMEAQTFSISTVQATTSAVIEQLLLGGKRSLWAE